ncbi:MAG: hypothetical protein RJA70_35 [Pseudomonadota bacterium]|jgi:hypothetical protein
MRRKIGFAILGLVGALASTHSAVAKPQASLGVTPAVCALRSETHAEVCFHGSVRADTLFLRERASDQGVGPFLEVGTVNFNDARLAAGGSWLIPIDPLPLVLSASPIIRFSARTSAGASARAFWGIRGFNYSGHYSAAGGLTLGLDYLVGSKSELTWHLGLQLDAMWLSLPALLVAGWARGPSD